MDTSRAGRYLARIGAEAPAAPDLAGLTALQHAHLTTVPFENLSIHLGEDIVLTEDALFEKIVTGRRGGFCYELNGLFGALLTALGYRVELLSCRVFGRDGVPGTPFAHLTLRVELDRLYLVDVGFGSFSDAPLRLDLRTPQDDPAGVFTVEESGEFLNVLENGTPGYQIDPRPYALSDFVPHCWWHRTSPDSHFTQSLTCSIRTADGRTTLSGDRLITTAGGERSERTLPAPEIVLAAYESHFGLTFDEVPVLRLG
ncbi:arylamine N-acetyltransferase family protein [Actinocorallia longicatena]|uniref:Arylamine N-acetyltransferase n=1 Tax=Actinocorallia longicatena TaxID=111803 RepID=A0ABP6QLN9_9ACTN